MKDTYTKDLEKMVIWLCDVYTQTQNALAVHEKDGQTDDDWLKIFMTVPTIQGSHNRIMVEKIGNLRTMHGNREGWSMTLEELYKNLSVGRKNPQEDSNNVTNNTREEV